MFLGKIGTSLALNFSKSYHGIQILVQACVSLSECHIKILPSTFQCPKQLILTGTTIVADNLAA